MPVSSEVTSTEVSSAENEPPVMRILSMNSSIEYCREGRFFMGGAGWVWAVACKVTSQSSVPSIRHTGPK